ncbi:2183_t:CDS:1, partial [Rhizophagus irregularis]
VSAQVILSTQIEFNDCGEFTRFGCPWNPGVCNYHCKYKVRDGNRRPCCGHCGGPIGTTCLCVYGCRNCR